LVPGAREGNRESGGTLEPGGDPDYDQKDYYGEEIDARGQHGRGRKRRITLQTAKGPPKLTRFPTLWNE